LSNVELSVLLVVIEKKSDFAFDILHWIAHVTKLLVFVSRVPAADNYAKEELQKHAIWLISVLSCIPDNKDTISFIESFGVTELLFEVALDAMAQESDKVSTSARNVLLSWAFKAGRHDVDWAVLERSMYALATLALWKDEMALVVWLKAELAKRLNTQEAPEQEMRDDAARELRRHAATLDSLELESSRIHQAMCQIDQTKMQPLLQEIADLLSPNTAGEPP
jgi:hypothetical protein